MTEPRPTLMTLAQAQACIPGSQRVGSGEVAFSRVHSDTRSLQSGDLFVALRGERFDGHAFLAQAAFDAPAQLSLRLVHATRDELDRSLTLMAVGQGRYVAAGQRLPEAGRWHLILEGPERQWRLVGVTSSFATAQQLGAQP